MPEITAQEFLRADELTGDCTLSGAELRQVFWYYKEAQREAQRQQAFWKSVNDSMSDAYKKLAAYQEELRASRKQLSEANEKLEQKVTERTALLDEALELAESIIASVSDSLIITAPNGVIKRANPAAVAMLGWPEKTLVGRAIGEIVAPDTESEQPLPADWLTIVLDGGQIRDLEAMYTTESSTRVPVVLSAAKVLGSRGDLLGVVCAAKDITERRIAERKLKEQLERIRDQQETIRTLFTPIIQVWDRVLALPILGGLDRSRVEEMTHRLLQSVVETRSTFVILDLTGVKMVDAETADHLLRISRATGLLGTKCMLSGLTPEVARSFSELDIDLLDLVSFSNLKSALSCALSSMHELPKSSSRRV